MKLPKLNLSAVQSLIDLGKLPVDLIKEFMAKAQALADAWQRILAVPDVEKMIATPKPGGFRPPVTLEDLATWEPEGNFIDSSEITARTKAMSEAMAKEKWAEGFCFAVSLLTMLGGGV